MSCWLTYVRTLPHTKGNLNCQSATSSILPGIHHHHLTTGHTELANPRISSIRSYTRAKPGLARQLDPPHMAPVDDLRGVRRCKNMDEKLIHFCNHPKASSDISHYMHSSYI